MENNASSPIIQLQSCTPGNGYEMARSDAVGLSSTTMSTRLPPTLQAALAAAATVSNIPYLQDAAVLALDIVTIIKVPLSSRFALNRIQQRSSKHRTSDGTRGRTGDWEKMHASWFMPSCWQLMSPQRLQKIF